MGGGQTVVGHTHRYDGHGHQPQVHPDTYPEQNGHIEAFHGILKREYIWPHDFANYQQAEAVISETSWDYNRNRLHSVLKYVPHASAVQTSCPSSTTTRYAISVWYDASSYRHHQDSQDPHAISSHP